MNFVPDQTHAQKLEIPFFEDQKDEKIPGRGTEKSCDKLQEEIRELMFKLNAFQVSFMPGAYPETPQRYGYLMTFKMEGIPGRIEIAALPIKNETPAKKDRALAQALYLIRNWLEGEVFSQVYRPGNMPLVPYLIGENNKTGMEALITLQGLPMLTSGHVESAKS